MSSCSTGRQDFCWDERKRLLVQQEDMSSWWARRHVSVLKTKPCLLVQQDGTSSFSTRAPVFLLNNRTSSCSTGRHVLLWRKREGLLVEQEEDNVGSQQQHQEAPRRTQETPRRPGKIWRQNMCIYIFQKNIMRASTFLKMGAM